MIFYDEKISANSAFLKLKMKCPVIECNGFIFDIFLVIKFKKRTIVAIWSWLHGKHIKLTYFVNSPATSIRLEMLWNVNWWKWNDLKCKMRVIWFIYKTKNSQLQLEYTNCNQHQLFSISSECLWQFHCISIATNSNCTPPGPYSAQ